ncbi:hypothetical protein ACJJTC_009273 [Scirpophaga incertulas]
MHSAIESQKKDTSVFSMQDWITICQRARRRKIHVFQKKKIVKEPYKTKEFKYHEFYDLKDLASKIILNKDKDNDLLYLIQKNIIPEELEPWYKNLKTANSVPEEEHVLSDEENIM